MYIRGHDIYPHLQAYLSPAHALKTVQRLLFFRCPFFSSVYTSLYLLLGLIFAWASYKLYAFYIVHSTITNFFVPKIHINQTLEEGVCLSSKYNNTFLDMGCYSCLATAEYQTYCLFIPCSNTGCVSDCSAFIDKYHCHQILCSQLQGA